jgi:hypothetical protein
MGRGSNNLNYDDGLSMREYKIFEPVLKKYTKSKPTRKTSRTLIDLTGTDAYAQIQGNVYGISLQ